MRPPNPNAMQRLPALLALTSLLQLAPGTALGAKEPAIETVSVGVFTVAPYVMAGADGPRGALIEFFDLEIAPRMGVRFSWTQPVTVARLEQNLIAGQIMFSPILTKTPAREKAGITFAGKVFVQFKPCIALLQSHKLGAIQTSENLFGMTIGWVQAGAIPPLLQDPQIKLDLIGVIDWETANLAKLEAGRIDGIYFSNPYTPQYYAAQRGLQLKLLDLPIAAHALHGAFAPNMPAALVARYENAARQAFAHGRFERYIERALAGRAQ
jgi:ABC-type amino acid transport substrate-binding protein